MLSRVATLLLIAFVQPILLAQPRSLSTPLEGRVLDPDGKAVVAAAIVIRNDATSDTRTTATDGAGRFSASNLPAGDYTVEVFVPGFDIVRRRVHLTGERVEMVAIELTVANITETV